MNRLNFNNFIKRILIVLSLSVVCSVTAYASIDLALEKTVDKANAAVGQTVTFTIIVERVGGNQDATATVIDTLPDELTFNSTQNLSNAVCSNSGQTITCVSDDPVGIPMSFEIVTIANASATVTNTATVTSDRAELDPDVGANTDSATVKIYATSDNERPFGAQVTHNLNGNMQLIGNTNIWKQGTDVPTDRNNAYDMHFVNVIGAPYYNSSTANLSIDPAYTIVWAGLYWQSHLYNGTSGSNIDNTKIGSYADGISNSMKVTFVDPNNVATEVTTDNLDYLYQDSDTRYLYSGFADVTELITENTGTYGIANIQGTEGQIDRWGNFNGWALLVIYEDPAGLLPMKNVSVFNGFRVVEVNDVITIPVSGFYTPKSGTINSTASVFVMDGDNLGNYNEDDQMEIQQKTQAGTYDFISDTLNPVDNIFNSTISNNGVDSLVRNPNYSDNLGYDLDTYDVSNSIDFEQTDTVLRMRTAGDIYFIDMVAFTTDLYMPSVCYDETVYTVDTSSGVETPIVGSGVEIDSNSTLRSKVFIYNNSSEVAEFVAVNRAPGQETILPYESDSTKYDNDNVVFGTIPAAGDLTTATDILDLDLFKFEGSEFSLNVGVDANSTIGGSLDVNTSTTLTNTAYMQFDTTLNSEDNVSFDYVVTFRNDALDLTFTQVPLPQCTPSTTSFWGRAPVIAPSGSFGIADPWRDYTSSGTNQRKLATKVSNKTFSLRGFSLNLASGEPEVYNGTYSNKTIPMSAFLSVTDDTCSIDSNDFAYVEIDHDEISNVAVDVNNLGSTSLTISNASKTYRIKAQVTDWRQLLIDASSLNCAASSLTNSLCGLPGCMNSVDNIYEVFPIATYPNVTTCTLGDGGGYAPCDSSVYNGNCGGKKDGYAISPSKYDNDLGCAACLADLAATDICSEDNFAVRPNDFAFDALANVIQVDDPSIVLSQAGTHPVLSANKLHSGEDYNMTIYARDFNNVEGVLDYNQSTASLGTSTRHYIYPSGALVQQDPVTTLNDVNITNTGAGGQFFDGNTTQLSIRYDEVGVVDLDLNDSNWAAVDSTETSINAYTVTDTQAIPAVTYSEPGYVIYSSTVTPLRLTVKPFDFNVDAHMYDGHDNVAINDFTYLSNDLNMSARFPVLITARNKSGGTTSNYGDRITGLYEQDIQYDLVINKTNFIIGLPN